MNIICANYAQMSDLSTLKLFLTVTEQGSFSAAARILDVRPSSVSRQISQLEANLGASLFQRTTRNQRLTEAGEIYVQHARRIVADIEAANAAVSELSDRPSGNLFITVEPDLATLLIEPLMPKFLTRFPNIKIRMSFSSAFENLVPDGVDVAIRVGHLSDSSFVARKLATSRSVVCASPLYLKQKGSPSHPRDLTSLDCLSFNSRSRNVVWQFNENQETIDVPINGPIAANGLFYLRQSAIRGLGIVMLPSWAIADAIKNKQLVPILETYPSRPSNTPINAVFSSHHGTAPKVRALVDFLADELRGLVELA